MATLEACLKYFGSKDIYEIFGLPKNTNNEKEIKKAYYKKALLVHPDRVPEIEKLEATEKFKILAKLNEVLTNVNKRGLYDEQGIIDEEDENFGASWLDAFRAVFKPITDEDIDNFKKNYIGSELETADIKKAYINGQGCWNYIHDHVPFVCIDDEPRIKHMVCEWIKAGNVAEFKMFIKEPKAKRDRRHKKYAREFKEASEMKDKMMKESVTNDLTQAIINKQQSRESAFDKLIEKYSKVAESKVKSKNSSTKKKDIPIKSGRVSKSRN